MKEKRHGRRYYLNDIPLAEARRRFHDALDAVRALAPTPSEVVPIDYANGRITAEPVWAKISSPHYDAAAMDGVAVRSGDTAGASETSPIRLKVGEEAVWLDTGDPVPKGFDAVIMVEVVHEVDDLSIEILSPAPPLQHVRSLGEDIVATELVLPRSHQLRPQDLAACATAGIVEVAVRHRPQIAIIPTGTELVKVGNSLKPGDIIESNSLMLGAMIEDWGGETIRWEPVPDDYGRLKHAIGEAAKVSEIVVVNAGSSAGSEDYTAALVEEMGTLLVHGVAVRPGHPVVLGIVDEKPILGIPGFPVSAAITSDLFVKPLIERKLGITGRNREKAKATLTRKVLSPIGEDEYLRVKLGRVGEKMVATPIERGAGVIMSMVRADGLVIIPRFSEGADAGDTLSVEMLRSVEEVENTIVAIGSHDITLDLLASELRLKNPGLTLASANVGSLGGLLAISRGEAHLSGTHLLDENTGEYNIPFVRRYVKGREVMLVNLVKRIQGLIIPHGNSKSIATLNDLLRDDVTFVNRQRGSGTRVLFDYMLAKNDMSPCDIRGYEREEYTHLSVAAAVAGERADVGLGIMVAAKAMGVGFVPLLTEQYDLAIPAEFYETELLEPLLSLIRSEDFRRQVEELGGYDTSTMGEVVAKLTGKETET